MRLLALLSLVLGGLFAGAWYGLQQQWFTAPVWPFLHLTKTAAWIGGAALLTAVLERLAAGISTGQQAWQQRLRERAGAEPGEPLREVTWAHWALVTMIWVAVPLILLDQ